MLLFRNFIFCYLSEINVHVKFYYFKNMYSKFEGIQLTEFPFYNYLFVTTKIENKIYIYVNINITFVDSSNS